MSFMADPVLPPADGLDTEPVPVTYLGVWQRLMLRRAKGDVDTSTRVFWLQTTHWHGDIRIPSDRPGFSGVRSLRECSDAQLQALCRQSGFTGITRVQADLCEWQRRIDFRLSEEADIGRMQFRGDDLDEFGMLSDYYEHWRRLPESIGPAWVSRLPACDGVPEQVLLVAGNCFMLLRDRPMSVPEARQCIAAIQAGTATREACEAFADFEISYGERKGGDGRILLSTLPWREGQRVAIQQPD